MPSFSCVDWVPFFGYVYARSERRKRIPTALARHLGATNKVVS